MPEDFHTVERIVRCQYCSLPSPDEAAVCEPCYDDRADLWIAFHFNGGVDPETIPFDVVLYEVGGSLRDEILGHVNKDKDFAVEAPSYDRMKEFLEDRGYNIFVETPEHLTIRAHFPNTHPEFGKTTADFVLCRKEGAYSDGRHPDHVEPGTIYDDLARRDFTCNAMARRLSDGEVLDPHNGREDLLAFRLRAVGSAEDRIREDALRAIRALRFCLTRNLTMTESLDQAVYSDWLPPLLTSVSAERRREELQKMFRHDTKLAMEMFSFYKLRDAVFSDGLWLKPTLEER